MKENCINCAYCSEHYPSFKDICDITGEENKDVYTHSCENFIPCETADGCERAYPTGQTGSSAWATP